MTISTKRELISVQEKEYAAKVISEILIKYDAQVDKQDVKEFCHEFVEERDGLKETDKVISEVNDGLEAIDFIESFHRDLIDAQNKGKSKLSYFKASIKSITNIKDTREIAKIVREIQSELAKTNNKQLSSLLNEDVEVFSPVREPTNEQAVFSETIGSIQNNSLLTTVSIGQQVESLVKNFGSENNNSISIAKQYFEDDFDDNDLVIKKLVTSGFIVAKDEFHIEALHNIDATGIAVMVDMGMTLAKVGYKVAQGKMKVAKAMDYIADRAIAGMGVMAEKVVKVKSTLTGATIGASIGSAFGPVGAVVGAVAGAAVGKLAGNQIAQGIRTGVKKVREVAESTVKNIVERTVQVAQNTVKAVTNTAQKVWNAIRF
ncbi:glycine zipper domain-containing protein [Nostoc sp. ChiSLP03a]|uniref:glycine zipper domain-containing protein n=1 Tax=Nostoc sp. ChiSLP03a TaxID=3075380 RepID=UPI002AD1E8EB|nr:glycine zipper domain-containing protein [Nostoc sp. ChiSLP03a]MDZ8213587.1 hypothetical protein [Nostoc sp. ChiSLP03a]